MAPEDRPATERDLDEIRRENREGEDRLIALIQANMERTDQRFDQIALRFDQIALRFDTQALRLDRQAALVQTDSRWITRTNEYAAKIDAAIEVKDRQIAELTERINKLEDKQRPAA